MGVLTPARNRAKGIYLFRDPASIGSFLGTVQSRAIREFPEQALASGLLQPSETVLPDQRPRTQRKRHVVQEELCIGVLELYLVGFDRMPLTEVAKKLPYVGQSAASCHDALRSESNKMKRLYDIANTFRGAGILAKEMLNGRVVFRWSYALSPLEIRTAFESRVRDSNI